MMKPSRSVLQSAKAVNGLGWRCKTLLYDTGVSSPPLPVCVDYGVSTGHQTAPKVSENA